MLLSVLMTCYNKEAFIQTAIESVLGSSFSDFELIILDDGSTDNSVIIAKDWEARDHRVKVFQNEHNLGDYFNRNKAASLAKGKYIKYVDADDYVYPRGLAVMVQFMEQFPDAGWGMASLPQDKERPFPFQLEPSAIFEYQAAGGHLFRGSPLDAIIRRDVFEAMGGFSGKRQMSDTEMWHLLSLKYPMVCMPQGLVWYRQYEGQESTQIRNELAVRTAYAVAKYHFYRDRKDIPVPAALQDSMADFYRAKLKSYIRTLTLKGKWASARLIRKMMDDHTYDFRLKEERTS